MAERSRRQQDPARMNYTPDGRYIPQGGGMRGWFQNRGVAVNEQMNQYRYHEAVDAMVFRVAGAEDAVANRRGAERKDVGLRVRWCTGHGEPTEPGSCRDLSLTGIGVRVRHELRPDAVVTVRLMHRPDLIDEGQAVLTLAGRVRWCAPVNPRVANPRYDAGIAFEETSVDDTERLSLILTGRVERLLPRQDAEEDADRPPGVDPGRQLRPARPGLEDLEL